MKKNLPFIIIMSLFVIACAAVTAFTIRNEPQYIKFTPRETAANTVEEADRINLNKATAEDLQKLPGIGETRANAIIAYREKHGSFWYIEELMDISGIGESIFDNIKDYVYVIKDSPPQQTD